MHLRLSNIGPRGERNIHRALGLLNEVRPDHYRRVFRELRGIAFIRGGCDGGLACTGADYGRTAVLASDPAGTDIIQLAVRLSHEARHHLTDRWGRHFIIEHSCRDCSNPWERALDPIYHEDGRLEEALRFSHAGLIASYLW